MHIIFRYEPCPISYQKLVGFYKERQKLSLTNKNKFPKNKIPTIFYWCQQDEWEKVFKEQVDSKFSVVKKKAWADQVKSFKSSNTYKSFPVSVRPKVKFITCFHDSWIYESTNFSHKFFLVFLKGRITCSWHQKNETTNSRI